MAKISKTVKKSTTTDTPAKKSVNSGKPVKLHWKTLQKQQREKGEIVSFSQSEFRAVFENGVIKIFPK